MRWGPYIMRCCRRWDHFVVGGAAGVVARRKGLSVTCGENACKNQSGKTVGGSSVQ